jgi:hypothetical protein
VPLSHPTPAAPHPTNKPTKTDVGFIADINLDKSSIYGPSKTRNEPPALLYQSKRISPN